MSRNVRLAISAAVIAAALIAAVLTFSGADEQPAQTGRTTADERRRTPAPPATTRRAAEKANAAYEQTFRALNARTRAQIRAQFPKQAVWLGESFDGAVPAAPELPDPDAETLTIKPSFPGLRYGAGQVGIGPALMPGYAPTPGSRPQTISTPVGEATLMRWVDNSPMAYIRTDDFDFTVTAREDKVLRRALSELERL